MNPEDPLDKLLDGIFVQHLPQEMKDEIVQAIHEGVSPAMLVVHYSSQGYRNLMLTAIATFADKCKEAKRP